MFLLTFTDSLHWDPMAHLNCVKIAVAICASLTVIFLKYEIEKRLKAVMVKEAVNNLVRVLRT